MAKRSKTSASPVEIPVETVDAPKKLTAADAPFKKGDRVRITGEFHGGATGTIHKATPSNAWGEGMEMCVMLDEKFWTLRDTLGALKPLDPWISVDCLHKIDKSAPSEYILPELLPLDSISPDPNQPRKHFSQEELDELSESIKRHGVLQAIIVRPSGPDSYLIVFGERRYRAAKLAGLETIPATIRDINDDQALELQIVENLQRHDVHPMEEARAFRWMYDHEKTVEDIAGRVGKSPKYVAARLKLTDLIPEFQEAFIDDLMEYKDARIICRQNEEVQKSLFLEAAKFEEQKPSNNGIGQLIAKNVEEADDFEEEDEYGFDEEEDEDVDPEEVLAKEPIKIDMAGKTLKKLELHNLSNRLGKHENNLDSANFKTEDPELYPTMGACGTCPHNSKNSPMLFMEEGRICNNSLCFSIKTKRSYQNMLQEYATDPNMLFIYNGYGRPYGSEEGLVKAAEEAGVKVLMQHEVEMMASDPGPLPVWETYLEEQIKGRNRWEKKPHNDEDIAEWKDGFDDAVHEWRTDIKEYEEWSKNENVMKAFVVAGRDKGTILIVKLKGGSKSDVPDSASAGLKVQISKVKEREARARELDAEKVCGQVNGIIKDHPSFLENGKPLTKEETCALAIHLLEHAGHENSEWLKKTMNVKGDSYNHKPLYEAMMKEMLPATMNQFIRRCIARNLVSSTDLDYTRRARPLAMLNIAKTYLPSEVAAIEADQKAKAEKRQKNVEKKIEELKKESKKPQTTE